MNMRDIQLTKDVWLAAQKQISNLQFQQPVKLVNHENQRHIKQDNLAFKNFDMLAKLIPVSGALTPKPTSKNVPQSVKFLDMYAQRQGLKSIGSVYQSLGQHYVGRTSQVTQDGRQYNKKYTFRSIQGDSPDLSLHFSLLANKAIDKWNGFVQAEAQLGNFLSMTKSEQGRQRLVRNYAAMLSKGTIIFKCLSSLSKCYLDETYHLKNPLKLKQQYVDLLKTYLRKRLEFREAQQMMQEIAHQGDYDNFKSIHKATQLAINSIKTFTTRNEFSAIEPLLTDKKAYILRQNILMPKEPSNQWISMLLDKKSNDFVVLTYWPGLNSEIQHHNYYLK